MYGVFLDNMSAQVMLTLRHKCTPLVQQTSNFVYFQWFS